MGLYPFKFTWPNCSYKFPFNFCQQKLSSIDIELEKEIDQYLQSSHKVEHNLPPLQQFTPFNLSEFQANTPSEEEISHFNTREKRQSFLLPEIIIHPPSIERIPTPPHIPTHIVDGSKEDRLKSSCNTEPSQLQDQLLSSSSDPPSQAPVILQDTEMKEHTLEPQVDRNCMDEPNVAASFSHISKVLACNKLDIIQSWLEGLSDQEAIRIQGSSGVIISTRLIRVQLQKRESLTPKSQVQYNDTSIQTSDKDISKFYLQPELKNVSNPSLDTLPPTNEHPKDVQLSSSDSICCSAFHRRWNSLSDSIKFLILDNLTYQDIISLQKLSIPSCQEYLSIQKSQISLYLYNDFEEVGSSPVEKARHFHHIWSEMIRLGYANDARRISATKELELIARLGIWESPMTDIEGVLYLKECICLGCVGQGSFWEILRNIKNRMINVEVIDSMMSFVKLMWDVIDQGTQGAFEEIKEDFTEVEMRCAIAELRGLLQVVR